MKIEIDEIVRQLVANIAEDFWRQLDGPFHRGGAKGLSFSAVRGSKDNAVSGFRIETGGLEWQERLSTIRTVTGTWVEESTASSDGCENLEEPRVYRLRMNVEMLEGLHRMAKEYVEQAEALRDRSGRLVRAADLRIKFLDAALSYYHGKVETIDSLPEH